MNPREEELRIIESMIKDATFALNRATGEHRSNTGDKEREYKYSIATSLIAIAKLLQLQAEQN